MKLHLKRGKKGHPGEFLTTVSFNLSDANQMQPMTFRENNQFWQCCHRWQFHRWPGRAQSSGFAIGFTSALAVAARSAAEMSVVVSGRQSTETAKVGDDGLSRDVVVTPQGLIENFWNR